MIPKPYLILASASIGRKQLLEKLGVQFKVIESQINEDIIIHPNPIKMLQMRAQAKAEDVTQRLLHASCCCSRQLQAGASSELASRKNHTKITERLTLDARRYLIIAADSMAILDGKTYGKCKTKAEGKKLLQNLMGKTHDFVTATQIILVKSLKEPKLLKLNNRTMKQWSNVTTTKLTLRRLSADELDEYVKYFDFTRFAAGYALNEKPWDLVTKIDGSYTNVIGLPFEIVLPIFRQFELVK